MSNKKGLLALSPLFLLIVLIVAFTVYSVDASHKDTNLSLTVAFMISSIYAVAISGGMPIKSRVDTYSKGAGANNLMLMLWIYVLAGSFAASAKAMGAVDATVNLALSILPASMILPGLFLAACFYLRIHRNKCRYRCGTCSDSCWTRPLYGRKYRYDDSYHRWWSLLWR